MAAKEMIIKDMFAKPIDRDITGVIKVGQKTETNIKQELEEYVVTRELKRHFRDFFSSYKRGIEGTTDKMGVWISGFFGSGKSHFLKVLSYLLENKEVQGKRAIDYFEEKDELNKDSMLLADMRLAGTVSTDVILFNIDSKSEMSGKQSKDAIVSVLLRVFNEYLGFCGAIPYLADLERKLSEEGKFDAFQAQFQEMTGQVWQEARNDFDFIQDDVVDVLADLGFMSVEAARNWCEKASGQYRIAIEDFAKLVKKRCEQKGKNHHVVFLIDEIGQYIGEDSKLMLNLQTVTEDLGRICNGKAWIIVTSQEDIDSVTRIKGNDFSKIQGRFDTRLSLSSANVDEVIRERILKKTEEARQSLALLYDDIGTQLKNIIQFNDKVEKKLYASREDFAAVYPFIPYQFNLLGDVLTAIRIYGASGKHLSEGERSMLAMFKESAVKVKDKKPGTLVPFYMFYDALERFLDHSHSNVITRALDNEQLNPEKSDECFDVNVLKTLFLIKYVKEIEANVEQITSLMVTSVDEMRLDLKNRVEESLKRLMRQTLVQKNGEKYIFLTNEEQEVNREINRQGQSIELGEIIGKVSELVFDKMYDEKKYRYPAFSGRYQFPFNQVVDNRPYRPNQNYDLTLRIMTPYSDEVGSEQTMRLISGQSRCVLVVLPDDRAFMDEIRTVLSIERFLRSDAVKATSKYEQIKTAKQSELRERNDSVNILLEEALKNAMIFVGGDKIQSSAKDIKTRINEAMGKLVSQVYHKLTYIDAPVMESDIRALLRSGAQQITLEGVNGRKNELALHDMEDYIGSNTERHTKTSMKSLQDRFMKAPYGYIEADVQWLVAKLFRENRISLYVNSEPVSLYTKSEDEVFRMLTRREYSERLMTDLRETISEKQKKAVRDVMKEVFRLTSPSNDDDELRHTFLNAANNFKAKLETLESHYQHQPEYPGRDVINAGIRLMLKAADTKYLPEFYHTIADCQNDFFDFADDFESVQKFFASEQRTYFDQALRWMRIYDDSKTFVVNAELEELVGQIKEILRMNKPYQKIYQLPTLNKAFSDLYNGILDQLLAPVLEAIEDARKRVWDEIEKQQCHQMFGQRCRDQFGELSEKAEACNNVAALQNIKVEADALKVRFLNAIQETCRKAAPPDGGKDDVPPPAKKHKTVSIRTVNASSTWQLETPEDVDAYVTSLQRKLKDLLEKDTVIHLEF